MIQLPRLSIREARARLADVIDQAERSQPTVITRRGRQVAAIVPIEILRRHLELEEREINQLINERMSEHSEQDDADAPAVAIPLEVVLRETQSRAE